jgi:hypothetical protein
MSPERPTPPAEVPLPQHGFGFTEHEQLYSRVSDARFRAILADDGTVIHRVDPSSNSFGEFLFVTVSRPEDGRRALVTFYGLGLHEPRDRWLVREWFWYPANPFPETMQQQVSRQDARALLEQRRQWITPFVTEEPQSERGRLFEMLADLTDDDGALAELEDLGDLADGLLDDFG